MQKMDKSLTLYELVVPYREIEQLMVFKAPINAIKGYRGQECNSFASEIYENLSDVARYMENIYQETYRCFKDKILKLDDDTSFRSDPNFELTPKAHQKIFGSKIKIK